MWFYTARQYARRSMTLVAVGVDGARGGWIAAGVFADGRTELRFFPTLERIAEWRGRADAPMAVDVPIGLMPFGGSRPCDFECRKQLPGKGSSVFPPPARFLVDQFASGHVTREQLRAAIFERRTAEGPGVVPGLSAQSCGIFDKVWEADRFVRVARRAECDVRGPSGAVLPAHAGRRAGVQEDRARRAPAARAHQRRISPTPRTGCARSTTARSTTFSTPMRRCGRRSGSPISASTASRSSATARGRGCRCDRG